MQQTTIGSDEVWVMLSEAEMWDQRRLLVQWLDEHAPWPSRSTSPVSRCGGMCWQRGRR